MTQPMKFRKKPVVIEAMRFAQGTAPADIVAWIEANGCRAEWRHFDVVISIQTLEGEMCANYGDWIIKGVKGEFYPCKPDIFEATYGEAEL